MNTAGEAHGASPRAFPAAEFVERRRRLYDAIGGEAYALLQGAPAQRGVELRLVASPGGEDDQFREEFGVLCPRLHALAVGEVGLRQVDGELRAAGPGVRLPGQLREHLAGQVLQHLLGVLREGWVPDLHLRVRGRAGQGVRGIGSQFRGEEGLVQFGPGRGEAVFWEEGEGGEPPLGLAPRPAQVAVHLRDGPHRLHRTPALHRVPHQVQFKGPAPHRAHGPVLDVAVPLDEGDGLLMHAFHGALLARDQPNRARKRK